MKYTSRNPNGVNQVASSSVAVTVLNTDVAVFTTSSLTLTGSLTASSAIISGNVTVLGTASINNLVVNQTKYSSGSNQLGDGIEDTQTLFGTVRIPTGSFTVTGSSIMSGSLNVTGGITGSLFGTASFASTASFVNPLTQSVSIRGTGTTSATTALRVENANASASLIITDNNVATFTTTTASLSPVVIRNGTTTDNANLLTFLNSNGTLNSLIRRTVTSGNGIQLITNVNGTPTTILTTDNINITVNGTRFSLNGPVFTFANNGYNSSVYGVQISSANQVLTYKFGKNNHGNFSLFTTGFLINYDTTVTSNRKFEVHYPFIVTGSATITGSLQVTSGITGSLFGTASFASTASFVNPLIQLVRLTGSLFISSSFSTSSAALSAYKSGSTVLDIQGSQGQLFSVVDSLTGSLMSVNDVSGLPILEVFSDDRIVMGTYGNPAMIVTGSVVNVTGSLVTQGQTIDPALIWFMS